ncbi:hypothetical protein [Corynebacterium ulceribovis]|uniref:hypothetical protein n=1 Tax=Corynebacterium ulceribovis TaxID=487732 RepID=UPI0003620C3D|nr:hypothetical protein [Corynebacterium ulceribovis]
MNREIGDDHNVFHLSDDELARTDELLTQLSQGSGSNDELTTMLAQLRNDVCQDIPAAPDVSAIFATAGSGSHDELAARRKRRMPAWASGFFGAAAASALILGSGSVIHAAKPGDALWSANQAIFGSNESDRDVVELASTLQQAEQASKDGDADAAQELLAQAHALLEKLNKQQRSEWEGQLKDSESLINEPSATSPERTTARKSKEKEAAPAETSSETATVTVTETTTVTETETTTQRRPTSEAPTTRQPDLRLEPRPEPAEPRPAPTTTTSKPTYSAPATPEEDGADENYTNSRPSSQLHSTTR